MKEDDLFYYSSLISSKFLFRESYRTGSRAVSPFMDGNSAVNYTLLGNFRV